MANGTAPMLTVNYPDFFKFGRIMDALLVESSLQPMSEAYAAMTKFRNRRADGLPAIQSIRLGGVAAMSPMEVVSEGSDIPKNTFTNLPTKDIALKSYKRIVSQSRESFEYDSSGAVREVVNNLSREYNRSLNLLAAKMYTEGYGTTGGSAYQAADGAYWFADTHTSVDGSFTQDNKFASTALTAANLEARMASLMLQKDESGYAGGFMATRLICGPTNAANAKQLLYSQYAPQATQSAALLANALNTFTGVELVVNPFITDAKWFLIDHSRIDAHLHIANVPTVEIYKDEDKDVINFKLVLDTFWGVGDWKGAVGMSG